jgi:transcription termination/antitermination protein NusA
MAKSICKSRSHPSLNYYDYLENLIPEIKDGTIEVMGISRDPGDRSKIGVKSNDPKVDPIGACVGEGGSRIREIVKALSDEKIDLFRWSDNEKELIANAFNQQKSLQ